MDHIKIQLTGKQADGYVIPLGPINLVNAVTNKGMVGCGAFDVQDLNNFGYPAARVSPSKGSSIATIDDLMQGIVNEVNPAAEKLGLKVGITGRDALELL
ncbi:MAG: YunC family protein [Methanothrix sp.]|nr:YunC family protein [Methanothrix sp.]